MVMGLKPDKQNKQKKALSIMVLLHNGMHSHDFAT